MLIKLLLATALLIGTMVVMYRIQRRIKGDDGGSLISGGGGKKKASSNASELEQFVAAYRREKMLAGNGSAPSGSPAAASTSTPSISGSPGPSGTLGPQSTSRTPGISSTPATAPAVQTPVKVREVFLAGPAKVLFLVLRAGLPDHQIFAHTRLADVLQLSGQPTTPQARAHFAQGRIDFVVCNKNLSIIALIDLVDGARSDDALKRALEPQFATGGVRYMRVASNAIPKPADVRQMVYPG
jgi:hypothetical protein